MSGKFKLIIDRLVNPGMAPCSLIYQMMRNWSLFVIEAKNWSGWGSELKQYVDWTSLFYIHSNNPYSQIWHGSSNTTIQNEAYQAMTGTGAFITNPAYKADWYLHQNWAEDPNSDGDLVIRFMTKDYNDSSQYDITFVAYLYGIPPEPENPPTPTPLPTATLIPGGYCSSIEEDQSGGDDLFNMPNFLIGESDCHTSKVEPSILVR